MGLVDPICSSHSKMQLLAMGGPLGSLGGTPGETLEGPVGGLWGTRAERLGDPRTTLGGISEDPWVTLALGGPFGPTLVGPLGGP